MLILKCNFNYYAGYCDKRYFRRFELYYDNIMTTPDVVDPDGFAELMCIPLNWLVNITEACQGMRPAYFLYNQAINPETFSRRVTNRE